MLSALIACSVIIFCFMSFVFLIAQVKKDNSIVDIVWGMGFIIIAIYTLFFHSILEERQILITLLTVLWGLRLSIYILLRRRGKGEDFRYREMREVWGENQAINSFFKIFMSQALIMLVVSLPIIVVNTDTAGSRNFLDFFGLILWSFGFVMETLADIEKNKFFEHPQNRGKVLNTGLWKYSRHPNYFGESVMWWGLYFIAVSSLYGASAVLSPLLLTILLLYVSGIPMLEKREMKKPDYRIYAEKTSKFIPWFPLKKKKGVL